MEKQSQTSLETVKTWWPSRDQEPVLAGGMMRSDSTGSPDARNMVLGKRGAEGRAWQLDPFSDTAWSQWPLSSWWEVNLENVTVSWRYLLLGEGTPQMQKNGWEAEWGRTQVVSSTHTNVVALSCWPELKVSWKTQGKRVSRQTQELGFHFKKV